MPFRIYRVRVIGLESRFSGFKRYAQFKPWKKLICWINISSLFMNFTDALSENSKHDFTMDLDCHYKFKTKS